MCYKIKTSKSFEKDLKSIQHKPNIMAMINDAIGKLKDGDRLPRQHALKGDMKGLLECHLSFGKLLVWKVKVSVITLERLGTHHQLLGL